MCGFRPQCSERPRVFLTHRQQETGCAVGIGSVTEIFGVGAQAFECLFCGVKFGEPSPGQKAQGGGRPSHGTNLQKFKVALEFIRGYLGPVFLPVTFLVEQHVVEDLFTQGLGDQLAALHEL